MRVLTLTLAKPCRIRCPPTPGIGTLTPKNGHEAAFHQLVKLAKATEINVLLDYNWIHADNREPLNRFFREPNAFAGFPDGNDGYTYVDWAVFDTTEEQDAPPPSYANAVDTDASRKRSRHATTRSPSTSPALKRHHYDPGSPTEIATATPSPRPPHTSVSSPLEKATASHTSLEATAALAFQTAINRAVEAQLPALVERMLPSILNTMLPDILHDMLAPQRSLSLSPPPVTTPPPRFASSSLGNTITDRLTELAKQHLTTIFDEASDQAYSLRAQADGDFEDVIADHKINVDSIKEDCIRELGEVVDEKLDRFKEQTDELIESAVEEMENKSSEVCEGIYDGLETFLNGASATLKNVRGGKTSGTRCTVRS